jgi:4-aminobutyrate aminotransferase-like enzyme
MDQGDLKDRNDSLLTKAQTSLIRYGGFTVFLPVVHCQGLYLYTANGRNILDFTSGHFSTVLGHGHPEIVETIAKHAAKLDHLLNGMVTSPLVELAEKLQSLLPDKLNKALFLSTGAESNEAAIKMAKTYTERFEIVALADSWHGMTGGSLSHTYAAGRKGHGPLVSTRLFCQRQVVLI